MFARLLLIALVLVAGCEKTDHESIDKWPRTEKGPGKLEKALADESLDPDLSAHAGVNMIKPPLSQEPQVRAAIEKMSPGRRTAVIEKMLPRLWEVARVENEKKPANTVQVAGKDALFALRKFADDNQRKTIDGYLVDWYGVYAYEARASAGHFNGPEVIRALGPAITKKLIDVVNTFLAAPGQEKTKYRIGDELMLAIAVSGSPDGVKKLLEIAKMDRGDPTLAPRAIDALFKAHINPQSKFDIVSPDPLVPNLDTLVAFAKDDTQKGKVTNDLIELIRAVGAPKCFTALVSMIPTPHRASRFKYVAANNALRCGGVKGIAEVVKALPESGAYVKDELTGAISGEIAKMTPRAQVQEAFRGLLDEKSVIARWVAIEGLAAMKSVEDQPKIAALSGARDVLVGYWGDNAEGKKDPTLGARAKELADQLAK